MVCRDFILPESANYVYFYPFFFLRNLFYLIRMQPGYREGRPPKYKPAQISHALELLDSGMTYRRVEELTGISKSTLIRARKTALKNDIFAEFLLYKL